MIVGLVSHGKAFALELAAALAVDPQAMCGKRSFVTSMGNRSISLAHIGSISYSNAARGKPPIPSKRLPIVRRFIGPPPQGCVPR